jgi:predicted nucleic acid-binding protein
MARNSGPARAVVCDAGPLIHLDELGVLHLLGDFAALWVPAIVRSEVERHRPSLFARDLPVFELAEPASPPTAAMSALSKVFALHAGETQALQIAHELDADLLLTDDSAARLAARELGLPVHGTVGILVRAIRRGQRSADEVVGLLRAIPLQSTLHIKSALLEAIVAEIEGSSGE